MVNEEQRLMVVSGMPRKIQPWTGFVKSTFFIMENTKTIGEQRVRTEFNPSQNDIVSQIKQKSADLINLCEELKAKDGRLASIAQTSYEEAAMWAVKAATA